MPANAFSALAAAAASSASTPERATDSTRRATASNADRTPPASSGNAAKTPLGATGGSGSSRSIKSAGHGLHGTMLVQIYEAKDLPKEVQNACVHVELGSAEANTPPAAIDDGFCTWDQEHTFLVDQKTEALLVITVTNADTNKTVGHAKLGFARMAKRDVKHNVSAEVNAWLPIALSETHITGSIHMAFQFTHFLDSVQRDPDAAASGASAPGTPEQGTTFSMYPVSGGLEGIKIDPKTPSRPRTASFRRADTQRIARAGPPLPGPSRDHERAVHGPGALSGLFAACFSFLSSPSEAPSGLPPKQRTPERSPKTDARRPSFT